MSRATITLVLITLLLLVISIGSCAFSINAMTDLAADVVAPPPSATDIIMQSRQTAPDDGHRANAMLWFVVTVLAMLLLAGFWILRLYFGARYTREMRLAKKRPRPRPPAAQLPQAPSPIIQVPPVLPSHWLGDGEHHDL